MIVSSLFQHIRELSKRSLRSAIPHIEAWGNSNTSQSWLYRCLYCIASMQQVPFAWSGYPTGLKQKHPLEDDDTDQAVGPFGGGEAAAQYNHGIHLPEHSTAARSAFLSAPKRRKGNSGKVTLPPELEPHFENLSLRNSAPEEYIAGSSQYNPVPPKGAIIEVLPTTGVPSGRGRLSSFSPFDTPRGRRDGTPTVSQSIADHGPHRRRSSSRNRARKTSSSSDADMKPAPRYDPARPHVVFVDSLSDSDEDNTTQASDTDFTSGDPSGLTPPGNSPSSSDTDDTVSTPFRPGERPIQMNKRLRDHLRKQELLQRLGHKPVSEGLLASAGPTTAGAGIRERGLVLYRPLSFGIVEEPDEDNTSEQGTQSTDVRIQELPEERNSIQTGTFMTQADDLDSMDLDQEMEIDG